MDKQKWHEHFSWRMMWWIFMFIVAALTCFYAYKSLGATKKSGDDTIKQKISEISPNIDISKPKISKDWNQEYIVINNDKDPIYTTGAWNRILTNFIATDESWAILPIKIPEKIFSSWAISVNASNANWKVTLQAICQDNWNIELDNWEKVRCVPKWTETIQINEVPSYKWIKILWIDATFADDNIKLDAIRDFFKSKGATFYSAQNNWIDVDNRGIRIDNSQLLPHQKKLFIFYNDANIVSDDLPKNLIKEFIQKDIAEYFTHLDSVQLYSFSTFWRDLDTKSPSSDIRTIMYWIWDCGETAKGCPNIILKENAYQIFSKNMIKKNDLDFFFIITATTETKRGFQY